MGADHIQMPDLIRAQARFSREHDHRVIPRGRKFLLVAANVLETDEVVEIREAQARKNKALVLLVEYMNRVVVLQHRLLDAAVLGGNRLGLLARNVGVIQDVAEETAQTPQIGGDGPWPQSRVRQPLAKADDALTPCRGFHRFPHEEMPLPIGVVLVRHHETFKPTGQEPPVLLDGAVAVIARDMRVEVTLHDRVMVREHLGKGNGATGDLDAPDDRQLRGVHLQPSDQAVRGKCKCILRNSASTCKSRATPAVSLGRAGLSQVSLELSDHGFCQFQHV